jgi:hypothetical protein
MGGARYADPRLRTLPSSVTDVEQFAAVLADRELGAFDVSLAVDEEIQSARIAVARLFADSDRDDVNLIYYSGHGLLDYRGRQFLAFRDTQMNLLSATGLSSQFILDEIAGSRARSNVFILDCSFAGAVIADARIPGNALIIASSGAHEYSFEEESAGDIHPLRSRFSAGLIEGLRSGDADLDGDGTVTFNELFSYARRAVESDSHSQQRPRLYDLAENPAIAGKAARSIFLSYSRADDKFASALAEELRIGGHRVWVDVSGIGGGDDWQERIGMAIEASKLVLTILTPEAFDSPWVRRELSYADKEGKPVLPIVHKTCELPPWYELRFGGIQRLDLTGRLVADCREELLVSIQRILQSRSASTGMK